MLLLKLPITFDHGSVNACVTPGRKILRYNIKSEKN